MEFELSEHAISRIKERGLNNPDSSLVIAKGRCKKLINETCKNKGYNKNYIYWRTNYRNLNSTTVYVCSLISKSKYLVITAFNLKLK